MSVRQEAIICLGCGTPGALVWEEIKLATGLTKELVWLDNKFYERISKKSPYKLEIGCRTCSTTWVSPLQP